jgi:TatD DNase family protein
MTLQELLKSNFLFDSHSHFSEIEADKSQLINDAIANNVICVVDVAVDLKNAKQILDNSRLFPEQVLPTAGIHPELLIPGSDLYKKGLNILGLEKQLQELRKFINDNKITIMGECGLDYFWLGKSGLPSKVQEQIKEIQQYLFEQQVKIAADNSLAMTIHSRAAEDDVLEILEPYIDELGPVVLHSFTGDYESAATALEMELYLGINGIITYKSADTLRKDFKKLLRGKGIKAPKDLYKEHFMLETDAPLLIPRNINFKVRENTPSLIKYIWEFVYNLINEI